MKLNLLPRVNLERTELDGVRHYKTPSGIFPSVTTILGKYYDKSFLEAWRQRVGAAEADKISNKAAFAGTNLHSVFEKFLLNQDIKDCHSIDRMRFKSVEMKIADKITESYGAEYPVYSSKYKTAGTIDGIVKWNDDFAIIDLKTAKSRKKEEYIENYFAQAAIYGIMLNELLIEWGSGKPLFQINKIVIVFSSNDFECYYFEKNLSDYTELVNKIFIGNR